MNGAIFARGDYRALRWMALFGVVFALGVGQAAAQPTVAVEGGTLTTLAEGGALVPVTAVLTVPANTAAQTNFTVTLTIEEDMAALPQEKAEIGTAATADVAWEATTPAEGLQNIRSPPIRLPGRRALVRRRSGRPCACRATGTLTLKTRSLLCPPAALLPVEPRTS